MGMRISSSSPAAASTSAAQTGGAAQWQQRQQDFKALSSALQSGDMGAAQSAYASLTSGAKNLASHPNSPMAKLGQALASGNLSAAQSAFASVGAHHPRLAGGSSGSSMPTWTPKPPAATASSGGFVNAVA